MNLNFTFGYMSRRTLRTVIHGIAPMDLDVKHLDYYVMIHLEQQVRYFPFWHRFGLLLGLQFLEWGAVLGGWGLLPLSFLKREQVTHRLHTMLHSSWPPMRMLIQGLKVLICLSAYGHPKVEAALGFQRRQWRTHRVKLHQQLMTHTFLPKTESDTDSSFTSASLPPPPHTLFKGDLLTSDEYLHDDAWLLLQKNIQKDLESESQISPPSNR